MRYWNETRGVPKTKLLIGQPFFGMLFTKGTEPGAAFTAPAAEVAYADLLADSTGWKARWDDTAAAWWATTPSGGYVTWDDPQTAALKAHWAVDSGYSGVIIWELSQDVLADGSQPMLDSLAAVLGNGASGMVPVSERVSTALVRSGNRIRLRDAGDAELSLYDLRGRCLRLATGELSLQGLPAGLYVVRAETAKGRWSGLFVME